LPLFRTRGGTSQWWRKIGLVAYSWECRM
jgi:hypothetical protein